MEQIYRTEYPRPQFVRKEWLNLNGEWEFEIDNSVSGKSRRLYEAEKLTGKIMVPFCPESKLSGVEFKDFMNCVWYRKEVKLPRNWVKGIKETGDKVLLHFGAVDYFTTVYVNGQQVGVHKGGYSSFFLDITMYLGIDGENVITVCAEDHVRSGKQPIGKQSIEYQSYGCHYTRTTGIWQTVWLEKVPQNHIEYIQVYPDVENTSVRISVKVVGSSRLSIVALYQEEIMGVADVNAVDGLVDVIINLKEAHLWEVGNGRLYGLQLSFDEDYVTSYFGLRSVRMDGEKFLLNGQSVFQRLVLDQGFYPEGIYTAPSDEALIRDIQISLAAGFNGARLHEKVFESRFLYHCDRLGYMVWGESGSWGVDISDYQAIETCLPEWTEIVQRDFNHPAIVGWCPLNETTDYKGKPQLDSFVKILYQATKYLDPTRPCIDTSGHYHVKTDIFDLHDYDQNPETFRERYDQFLEEGILDVDFNVKKFSGKGRQIYRGEPVMISEYGGITWDMDDTIETWGYGNNPKTKEEFIERYRNLTKVILKNKKIFGFCYTQLYDVEQEKNGLYTYSRLPKFNMEIFKEINSVKAAIED